MSKQRYTREELRTNAEDWPKYLREMASELIRLMDIEDAARALSDRDVRMLVVGPLHTALRDALDDDAPVLK